MDRQQLLDLMHAEAVKAGIRALVVRGVSRREALYSIIQAAQQNDENEIACAASVMYEQEFENN